MLKNADRHDILKRLETLLHNNLQQNIPNAGDYGHWHGDYVHVESSSTYVNNKPMTLPNDAVRWPTGLAEHINRVAIATASHVLNEVLTKREYQEAVKISYLNVIYKMTIS